LKEIQIVHGDDLDELEIDHQLEYQDRDDKDAFPNVNAPSLELSRTNTPRLSAGLRDHSDIKSKKVKTHYTKNLAKTIDGQSSLYGPSHQKAAKQSLRRILETFNSRMVDSLSKENAQLRTLVSQKNDELISVTQKQEEMEEYVGILKSQSAQEAELVQSRILQKIKGQREQALASEQFKEKQIQELVAKLQYTETEFDTATEVLEEELEHLAEEMDKANVLVSSYKAQEGERSQEIERLRQEVVTRDRKLETLVLRLQEKERDANEIKLYLRDSEKRIGDLQQVLESRDAEFEELLNENRKIKDHLEELMQNPERKVHKEEPKLGTMDEDERSQLEWTINELKKQLAVQNSHLVNSTQARNGHMKSDKMNSLEGYSSPVFEPLKQVSTADKSEQCTHLENYFKSLIEYILKENRCLENTYGYSLGELHSYLTRFVQDLSTKQSQLLQENDLLRQKIDNLRSKVTDESSRDSVSILVNQMKLIKDDNESLRNIVQTQKEEIIGLSTALSQRSSAKNGMPRSLQAKSNSFTQTTASFGRLKDHACQTEKAKAEDLGVQVFDDVLAEKTRQLEKTVKEVRHDVSIKSKLIKEQETQKTQLEEEIRRLKSQTEQHSDGRRKTEQLEKKLALLSQDISAKDKKNLELYDEIKKLKVENDSLNEALKINSDKSFSAKMSSKRTQSTVKPLSTTKPSKTLLHDLDAHVDKVNEEVREAKSELGELYKKVA
jgi:chromosome segregation ATPase